jgi:hypothetical protein
MMGIPFHLNARIIDIVGRTRVEAVKIQRGSVIGTLECDGVLFSGQFTPEASLFQMSGLDTDRGSSGPAVDQNGQCENPVYFAAGNVLRAVETGGWAFREGRAIGRAIAADLGLGVPPGAPVRVTYHDPVKLVVPSLLRSGSALPGGLEDFQLRFLRRAKGTLTLEVDGVVVWRRQGNWMPETRIGVPRPAGIVDAGQVHFGFQAQA